MPPLEQRRAAHALGRVENLRTTEPELASRYRSYARSLPMILRQNGLGQSIALKMAQSGECKPEDKANDRLLSDFLSWLCDIDGQGWETTPYKLAVTGESALQQGQAVIGKITSESEDAMIRAQGELMSYLRWLKLFAEALLPKDVQGDKEPEGASDANSASP